MNVAEQFSALAARYREFRPRYPQALADALAALAPRREAAWDAGCGNGQLSVQLAAHFARVHAQDPSQAQLDAAERHPRVRYACAPAEASGLPEASVDLAVAAQAAHWFDWPRYTAEVARVARPGALVGLVSYGITEVEGEAADRALARYRAQVGPYWPKGRAHVENGYRDLVWPWPEVEAPPIDMTATWTRDELVGYVTTWTATANAVEVIGSGPFDELRAALEVDWSDNAPRTIRWPLAIKLARR